VYIDLGISNLKLNKFIFKKINFILLMANNITLEILVDFFNNKVHRLENILKNNDKYNLQEFETFNSKYFKYFNNLFEYFVDRNGIKINDKKQNNISLLNSILYCLDDDYYFNNINFDGIKKKIIDDVISRKCKLNYSISKKLLIDRMKSKNVESIDIYIYSLYFNINIFVFDFETNKITLYYSEPKFNIYKINIFLSKYKNIFNPITYKNDNYRYFKYTSSILLKIIKSEFKIFHLKTDKELILDDYDGILKKYNKIDLNNIIVKMDDDIDNFMSSESNDEKKSSSSSFFEKNINLKDCIIDYNKESKNIEHIITNDKNKLLKKLNGISLAKLKREKKNNLIKYLCELNNEQINENKYKTKLKTEICEEILKYIK
tara:strand:+ start:967 stop:2094 length:1128 start_codon:yes stop_codon:yes gene_type:complete